VRPRGSAGRGFHLFDTLGHSMDRDATFLLSLVTFAVAAFTVGICGWIMWSRSRDAGAPITAEHPDTPEES
jgi:hypothetical protein